MKYLVYLLAAVLVIVSVSGQVSVQQILSEETDVYQNGFLTVNYRFRNHKELPIVNIRLIDKYPKDKFKSFRECSHCELVDVKDDGDYKTLYIKADDIKPKSSLEVSYSVNLKSGKYNVILGEKYYNYMNRTQHRLGNAREVEIEKKAGISMFIIPMILAVLVAAVLAIFRKKRK